MKIWELHEILDRYDLNKEIKVPDEFLQSLVHDPSNDTYEYVCQRAEVGRQWSIHKKIFGGPTLRSLHIANFWFEPEAIEYARLKNELLAREGKLHHHLQET